MTYAEFYEAIKKRAHGAVYGKGVPEDHRVFTLGVTTTEWETTATKWWAEIGEWGTFNRLRYEGPSPEAVLEQFDAIKRVGDAQVTA